MRIVLPLLAFAACAAAQESAIQYPETERVEHVDSYHGVEVADPYRWLEQDVRESKDVADWVRRENEVTFDYLESIPAREPIRKRIEELWDYEKFSGFGKEGGRYFYYRNDGLQNQYVLWGKDSLDGEARVLLDPNEWSADGTVSLGSVAVSEDGRYAAYSVSESGSDWRKWKIVDIESGETLPDVLEWSKFSEATWTHDSRGFFYGRYDEPSENEAFQSTNLNQKIYYHRLGTAQADDTLVYARPEHPDWGFATSIGSDGRYLVLTVWKGTDAKYRILYRDLADPYAMPIEIVDDFENDYTFIDSDGPTLYFRTDLEAPTGRLIAIDVRKPAREHWREVIPAAKETLVGVTLVGNLFLADYLEDASSKVKVFRLDGEHVRDVELPGIGTASGFDGSRGDLETFYLFSGFATPPTIYRYDLLTGESSKLLTSNVAFDPDAYVTEQVFYESADGTRIPMFLTYRKGLERDGSHPTLLYGYGGFNIPITPSFSVRTVAWLDLGGVWASANLRGGGEYGEDWHQAGTRTRKQNVFDDFIAAAEWLIDNKITSKEKLAIHGRSNGGLVVGAVMTQRPDLFGATLPAVGVMDMLRFNQFTAGRFWVDDYGSPDEVGEFEALYGYSPYHSLRKHESYPPTLVTTADTDDRVVPSHSFKFAAELQHRQKGPAPVLIRIETSAGHGAGKPTSKIIEELADQYAFLAKNLGMKLD